MSDYQETLRTAIYVTRDISLLDFVPGSKLLKYINKSNPDSTPWKEENHALATALLNLGAIITKKKLYDPTNWESIICDDDLEDIFQRKAIFFKDLPRLVCREMCRGENYTLSLIPDDKSPLIIQAPWFSAASVRPLIQIILERDREIIFDYQDKYYLSPDLLDFFRFIGKGYPNKKRFSHYSINRAIINYLESNPVLSDCREPLIFFTRNDVLFQLGDSNTLLMHQIPALIRYHCRKFPYAPVMSCNCCFGGHYEPSRDGPTVILDCGRRSGPPCPQGCSTPDPSHPDTSEVAIASGDQDDRVNNTVDDLDSCVDLGSALETVL